MRVLPLLLLGLLACRAAFGGVVRIEVKERSDVAMPPGSHSVGPYERVVGTVHFADDPVLIKLHAPVASNGATPITGIIRADFVPDERTTQIGLADRNHVPYPVANPEDPTLQLTVRDRRDGPRTVIPRAQWHLDEKR